MPAMGRVATNAEGYGIAKDEKKAFDLFQQGCGRNDSKGCYNLGVAFAEGRGTDRNDPKAVELFEKACNSGDAQGCADLGFMYSEGRGVEVSHKRAVLLLQRACDGNDAEGCYNLAIAYTNALGAQKDTARSLQLFEHACNSGSAMLVLILALCIRQVKVCGRIEDELRTCLRELAMRVWEKHAITSESRAWKGETRSGPPIYFDEPATQIMPKAASILVWHTLMVEDWIRMRSWRWNRSIAPVMRGAQRGVPISAICIWPVMGSTKIVPLRAKRSRKRAIRESRAHVLR